MSVDTAIARFRQRQRDVLRDEATVTRPGVGGTLDSVTGVWTPAADVDVYTGPCLLRALAWEGTDAIIGDDLARKRRVRAKFPVDTDIQVDDIVVPTASTYDLSLIGVSFRVTDGFRDGWQIARVAILEEVIE